MQGILVFSMYSIGYALKQSEIHGIQSEEQGDLPASILSQGTVVIVDDAGNRVKDDILKNGAKFDSIEDVGFSLGSKADALGITTALDIKHPLIAPAVLIVSDQSTLGISGK